jgi:hypothetical protein
MGLNVAVTAYRRVNVQMHHTIFGMTFHVGPVTCLAGHALIRVGAFDRVKIGGVTTHTRAILNSYLLAAGHMA